MAALGKPSLHTVLDIHVQRKQQKLSFLWKSCLNSAPSTDVRSLAPNASLYRPVPTARRCWLEQQNLSAPSKGVTEMGQLTSDLH